MPKGLRPKGRYRAVVARICRRDGLVVGCLFLGTLSLRLPSISREIFHTDSWGLSLEAIYTWTAHPPGFIGYNALGRLFYLFIWRYQYKFCPSQHDLHEPDSGPYLPARKIDLWWRGWDPVCVGSRYEGDPPPESPPVVDEELAEKIRGLIVERFFRSWKEECIWQHILPGFIEARREVAAWIRWYNQRRPHQALADKSPTEFRAQQGQRMA